jgi:hypothetical protein
MSKASYTSAPTITVMMARVTKARICLRDIARLYIYAEGDRFGMAYSERRHGG